MAHVIIPKEYEGKRSLVAIPKKEYEAYLVMRRTRSRPASQAKSREDKELAEVLAMIEEAEAEYRAGTTTRITSADQLRSL